MAESVHISQGKTQLFHSGRALTAKDLNQVGMNVLFQGSDQGVTSSTTFVGSTGITFTPDVGAVYYYELMIAYTAVNSADLKWRWNAPHALISRFTIGSDDDTANTDTGAGSPATQPGALAILRRPANSTEGFAAGMGTASALSCAFDRGTFATDGTSGAVTLEFAQRVSNATAATLRANTTLLYQRIA